MPRLCLKVPYDTPREAREALRRIRQRKQHHLFERKPYHCEHCGKYHLTKMRSKDDRAINNRRRDHE